jgi:D-alanyl-D-alanine carboxypeptidase/D-alanyl-D-alanine-endopeptidase (penicillin-binding protein 4)
MSGQRVDVVTGPVRYRWVPLLLLVLLALVPVAALSSLLVWSDNEADAHEQAIESGQADPVTATPSSPPSPALPTALLAYRRTPDYLEALGADAQLADAMEQLEFFVDERSCLAVSVDGRPVTAHNVDLPVIPASTHKLLVGSVALEMLGPEYRFTTTAVGPPAVDGVVDGNLFLVGGGDPLLVTSDFPTEGDSYPEFNTTSLDVLADLVAAAGVRAVTGSVLGDGTRYDDEFVNPAWGAGDAFVEAGPYDALVVNDSRILGRTSRQLDPNAAAASEFARLLRARGIQVGGSGSGAADPALPVVASIESEPLTAIVAEMLTTSDDDTAEMLLKELGVADSGEGTVAAGLNVVDRTLRTWGVPMQGVRLLDASGLSPDNRLTCDALLAILQRVRGTAVQDGLAVAGRTGTLQGQFTGTPMEGRLLGKTGTLDNPPDDLDPPAVKALAGYLPTEQAGTVEFVLVLNGPTMNDEEFFTPYWLALSDRLATYPSGPDRATVGPVLVAD